MDRPLPEENTGRPEHSGDSRQISLPPIIPVAAGFFTLLIVVLLIHWGAEIFCMLFAGILLGIAFDGMAGWVSLRLHLRREGALALILLLLVCCFGAIVWLGGTAIAGQIKAVEDRIPDIITKARASLHASWFGRELLPTAGKSAGTAFSTIAAGILGTTFTYLLRIGDFFVMLLIGIFFAFNVDFYKRNALIIFPKTLRPRVRNAVTASGRALRSWLVGRIIIMGTLGLLAWIGLYAIGTPLPFLLALITALCSFVPFIGPIAAAIPAILLGLSVSMHLAIVTLIVYLIVQLLENNIITPFIQKQVTDIPPVVSIIVQILFGVLAGVFGLLLATPAAVVVIVFVQTLYVRDTLGEEVKVIGE